MAACRSFQRALELDHKNAQAQQEVWVSLCLCQQRQWVYLGRIMARESELKSSLTSAISHTWVTVDKSHSFSVPVNAVLKYDLQL